MDGALYFPYIEVPTSMWFSRALLYWDRVGTIVPETVLHEPEHLSPYMLDLVRSELLLQVEPNEIRVGALRENFRSYLDQLTTEEVEARQEAFQLDSVERIHPSKFLDAGADLFGLQELGLAESRGYTEFAMLERRTAAEFMAALALTLCEPDQRWQSSPNGHSTRWLPISDEPEALQALVSGLSVDEASEPLFLRIQGHHQNDRIRLNYLERLLPVPADPVPVDRIVRFRDRYGDLLPQLRRYLEREVDATAEIRDPAMRQRHIDRISDELEERIDQARAYMSETLQRRVVASRLLRCVKHIPVLGKPAEVAHDLAEASVTQPDFTVEPLAYLAFAHAEFVPRRQAIAMDPRTGLPLGAAPLD